MRSINTISENLKRNRQKIKVSNSNSSGQDSEVAQSPQKGVPNDFGMPVYSSADYSDTRAKHTNVQNNSDNTSQYINDLSKIMKYLSVLIKKSDKIASKGNS